MATLEPLELKESKYEPGTYFLGAETWKARSQHLIMHSMLTCHSCCFHMNATFLLLSISSVLAVPDERSACRRSM